MTTIYIKVRGPMKTDDSEYHSKYYLANRQKRLDYQYNYYRENKAKIHNYNKEYWLQKNKEKIEKNKVKRAKIYKIKPTIKTTPNNFIETENKIIVRF